MDEARLRGCLRLIHSKSLGAVSLSGLIAAYGGVGPVLTRTRPELEADGMNPGLISRVLAARQDRRCEALIDQDWQWQEQAGHSLIDYESSHYPARLREIVSAPPLLYVVGDAGALQTDTMAIVGSRRAGSSGLRNACWMAKELSEAGLAIASGLARGIDTRVHQGALAGGSPTLAVMGTGADCIYPIANADLAKRIAGQGALVTELPLGTPPLASNFPRRNRIISGLSLGVLIVEATPGSGSLITARFAAEQNREVFAIPGSINYPGSRGCHRLLKEGARLVEEPADVLEELGLTTTSKESAGGEPGVAARASEPPLRRRILRVLGADGCLLDTLIDQTGVDAQQLTAALLELEMTGEIESIGGRYMRIPAPVA